MRRILLSVVLCLFVAFLDVDLALAKKGGGGRGPGGPGKSSRPVAQSKHRTGGIPITTASPLDHRGGIHRSTLSQTPSPPSVPQPWTDPRLGKEERKLQHLFDVAQKLRDVAGRNGNENLLRTAEKIEQVAISRYERNLGLWADRTSAVSQPEVTSVPSTIAAKP